MSTPSSFDVTTAIKASRAALTNNDYATVHRLLCDCVDSDVPLSPSLIIFSMRAALAETGSGTAAWDIFDRHAPNLRPDQRMALSTQFKLFLARHLIDTDQPQQAIDLLLAQKNWTRPDRQEMAFQTLIEAELLLGQTNEAARLCAEQLVQIKKPGDIEDACQNIFQAVAKSLGAKRPRNAPRQTWSVGQKTVPTIVQKSILWTKEQLLQDIPGLLQISGPSFMRPVESVSFHRHSIGPGTLVIPAIRARVLREEQAELHEEKQRQITEEALRAGASAVIVDNCDATDLPQYAPVFKCEDRVQVFEKLAALGRARISGSVIGITGSYGKTTTRDMVSQMLGCFEPTSTQHDNRNALSGICETLSSTPLHIRNCVLELGISIPETMSELTRIAQPDIALVLDVADSHLGNYQDQSHLLREKLKIFEGTRGRFPALVSRRTIELDRKLGTYVLDQPGMDHLSVGSKNTDAIQLLQYTPTDFGGTARIRVESKTTDVALPAFGAQFAVAACYALGVAHLKGIDISQAAQSLSSYRPLQLQRGTRWRLRLKHSGGIVELLDDAQNASLQTTRTLLEQLARRTPKRLVLVMGDMLELGEHSAANHIALASDISASNVGLLITIGTETEVLHKAVQPHIEAVHFSSVEQAGKEILAMMFAGDLIALKGSGGMKLGQIRTALAEPSSQEAIEINWKIEHEVI